RRTARLLTAARGRGGGGECGDRRSFAEGRRGRGRRRVFLLFGRDGAATGGGPHLGRGCARARGGARRSAGTGRCAGGLGRLGLFLLGFLGRRLFGDGSRSCASAGGRRIVRAGAAVALLA